jgi:hypothetical protein
MSPPAPALPPTCEKHKPNNYLHLSRTNILAILDNSINSIETADDVQNYLNICGIGNLEV